MKKLPPIEKVYEAFSAIADGRVRLGDGKATVVSSDNNKQYIVFWSGNAYSSNDNATFWQGYAGYPIIAVLLLRGLLPLDKTIVALFAGINWTEANAGAQHNYAKAAEEVFDQRGYDISVRQTVRAEAERVYQALSALSITVTRVSRPAASVKKKDNLS